MQTSPLVHHLIDLNSSDTERAGANVLAPFGATHSASRIAQADAAGFERGRRASDHELRQALADQHANLTREFEDARRQWVDTEAAKLSQSLEVSIAAVRTDLAATLASTITPFLVGRLRDQAMDDVVGAVEKLVSDGMPLSIEVSGPPDLAGAVAKRLEPLATVVKLAPVASPELRVRVDTRIVETRLNDWLGLIEGALK